jgi:hypothetical protein
MTMWEGKKTQKGGVVTPPEIIESVCVETSTLAEKPNTRGVPQEMS